MSDVVKKNRCILVRNFLEGELVSEEDESKHVVIVSAFIAVPPKQLKM